MHNDDLRTIKHIKLSMTCLLHRSHDKKGHNLGTDNYVILKTRIISVKISKI